MEKLYKFSIVIPALNEEALIESCLNSLKNQDYKGEFEITVIDNGSIDKTSMIARKNGVKVLLEPIKGISNALIKGCQNASGEVLIFTDADTTVPNNWLSAYNKIFNLNEEIVAAGGIFLFSEKRFFSRVFFNKIMKPILLFILEKIIQPKYSSLSCVNMAVKKEDYEKVGGFDSSIKWGQELDLVKKLLQQGKIFFDRNLIVYTSGRRYFREDDNWLIAFLRSMKEVIITIYRGVAMHTKKKTFSAQKEIRKNN